MEKMNVAISEMEKLIRKNLDQRGMDSIELPGELEKSARSLMDASTVMVITGFVIRDVLRGETDGPLGAVSIVNALTKLGKHAVLVTDQFSKDMLESACKVLGLSVPIEAVQHDNLEVFCSNLFLKYQPSHILAIERPGRAMDGRCYSMRGEDISDLVPNTDVLFELAKAKGTPTLAVGDGGNELGMGNVKNQVQVNVDNGDKICAVLCADRLVLAGVSNWGGHALAGALSVLSHVPLLHTVDEEKVMLEKILEKGAVDGCTKKNTLTVDGLSFDENAEVLSRIKAIAGDVIKKKYLMKSPEDVRLAIRNKQMQAQTAGLCPGYAQANLVILPKNLADEFKAFADLNKVACPLLETTAPGETSFSKSAPGSDILNDVPMYRIYKNGELVEECSDIKDYWQGDFVSFLLGCSFTFESALISHGIKLRHIEENRNVSMYITNIDCVPAGIFKGPLVVSMRPIPIEQVGKAIEITSHYPKVHGGPIHVGNPEAIGIEDITSPDFGDYVEVKEDEVPVFWACGVTSQAAAMEVKPEIMITHAPGHMFITDIHNEELFE